MAKEGRSAHGRNLSAPGGPRDPARSRETAASAEASASLAVAAAYGRSEGGWVLSMPYDVRFALAKDCKLLSGVNRVLVRVRRRSLAFLAREGHDFEDPSGQSESNEEPEAMDVIQAGSIRGWKVMGDHPGLVETVASCRRYRGHQMSPMNGK